MTASAPKPWRRGFSVSVVLSVFLHVALLAAVLLLLRHSPRLVLKRGEPLFVELRNLPGPAPKGNPAERSRAAAAREARAIPPAPAGAERPPVTPPAIREMPASTPRVASVPRPEAAPIPPARERAPLLPRAEPRGPRPETPLPSAERDKADRLPPAAAPPAAKVEPPAAKELPAAAPPRPEPSPARPPAEAPAEAAAGRVAGPTPVPVPSTGAVGDRLAALRPHAPGGGLIGGRSGIEGEPIPLDTKDPKFSDYFEQLRRAIKEKWSYPREAAEKNIGGQLVLEFGIAKDGQLRFIDLRRSSGVSVLDDYAVNAVKLASPFPPIPDAMSRAGIPVVAIFNYIIEGSLYNVLR
jgi:periplasmic protein TonB